MPLTVFRRGTRRGTWLAAMLGIATLPVLCLWLWPVRLPDTLAGLSFTQWHTLLELASISVCGAVVTIAWNARELEVPHSVTLLGSACAGALVLDLLHTLSFPGMPDLLGPNDPTRTTALFMTSRLLVALAVLAVAALPAHREPGPRWARWVPVGVARVTVDSDSDSGSFSSAASR